MQLKRPIGATLATATCGLLGALPAAPAVAQEVGKWEVNTSLLYYGESDDRVTDGSVMASVRRALDEDRSFSFNFTVDTLTGATPNGAVPAHSVQTFTAPPARNTMCPGRSAARPDFPRHALCDLRQLAAGARRLVTLEHRHQRLG
jgi:hypothetical protein